MSAFKLSASWFQTRAAASASGLFTCIRLAAFGYPALLTVAAAVTCLSRMERSSDRCASVTNSST